MAEKSRSLLVSDSDSVFLDNTSGQIIPANHRQFNDDMIESTANIADDNVFQGVNEFTNLVINKQKGTNVASTGSLNIASIDGNIISIEGTTQINEFIGNIGQIMYATFVDSGCVLNAQNGSSINPPHNLLMNAGDTLIFTFTSTDVIRVLGLYRQNGQQYFQLADVAAYTTIKNANALQIGATYVIPLAYYYPNNFQGFQWWVKFTATATNAIDLRMQVKQYGSWYDAIATDDTFIGGTIRIYNQTEPLDEIGDIETYFNNYTQQLWGSRSRASLLISPSGASKVFRGYGVFDDVSDAVRKNLLNLNTYADSYFGRILDDFSNPGQYGFYYHHGTSTDSWGNNVAYPGGFDGFDLVTLTNNETGQSPIDIILNTAIYHVVNDVVTISAQASMETKFISGTSGHDAIIAFPLPFALFSNISGHGTCRFDGIPNHADTGIIVEYLNTFAVLVRAKWSAAINLSTSVTIDFTISYLTNP